MNPIKIGIDFFSTVFSLFIIQHYFVCLGKQLIVSKKIAYIVFAVALVLMTATSPLKNRHAVLPLLSFAVVCVISLLFSGKKSNNIFLSIILIVLLVFSELVVGALMIFVSNMYFTQIRNTLSHYTLGVLISTLFAFFLIKILAYKKIGAYESVSIKSFLGLLLMPVVSMFIIYAIGFSLQDYQNDLITTMTIGILLLICLANFLVFHLFESQMKNGYVQNRLELIEKQIGQQAEYYEDISNKQMEIRKLSHDMNHYLSGIWGFLKQEKYDDATHYLEQISKQLKNVFDEYATGQVALDAVLHLKKQKMHHLGIRFDSSIILPENLEIDTIDLCVILGNGLDNAIEACEKILDIEKRFIWFNMHMCSPYMLSICIENPIGPGGISASFPGTSKKDTQNHGFGLASIQTVVNKYDGSLDMAYGNDIFQLALLMNNKEVEFT